MSFSGSIFDVPALILLDLCHFQEKQMVISYFWFRVHLSGWEIMCIECSMSKKSPVRVQRSPSPFKNYSVQNKWSVNFLEFNMLA